LFSPVTETHTEPKATTTLSGFSPTSTLVVSPVAGSMR
jgi:hypothetical protein